jgi:hypothetical protein
LEGSNFSVIAMLYRVVSEGTEKNQEKFQEIQDTNRDIKYDPLGYK